MMTTMYVLGGDDDHTPVPEPSVIKWSRWMEKADRHVAQVKIGSLWISTVFLGIDHKWGNGPPIVFETMIFGFDENDSYQTRCATWDEAVRMHALAADIAQTLVDVANVSLAAFGEMGIKLIIKDEADKATC